MKKIKHLADFGKPLTREEMKNVKAGFTRAACDGYCKATEGPCSKSGNNGVECTCVDDLSVNCPYRRT